MKIAVFDVDDTLILHGRGSETYYQGQVNTNIVELLYYANYDRIYLYTNGTHGHGVAVAEHLGITDYVSKVFGRDSEFMPSMKPHETSFLYVNSEIERDTQSYNNEIHFYDDLKENLKTAYTIGWETNLIQQNGSVATENYIDHVYPNIYAALLAKSILEKRK
tara:strand:+ start:956 stop:1444 length:489 start_codon:yes stop_codon:yes gene_type:complete